MSEKQYAFWIGGLSCLGLVAGAILAWFAFHFSEMRSMYSEFRSEIPAITKLVTNPVYLKAVPAALILSVVLSNLWMKRSRPLLILAATTAVVGVACVIVGYWAATLPIRELAGNITAE